MQIPHGTYNPVDLASNFTTFFYKENAVRLSESASTALALDLAELFEDIRAGRIVIEAQAETDARPKTTSWGDCPATHNRPHRAYTNELKCMHCSAPIPQNDAQDERDHPDIETIDGESYFTF